ncbi:MAG: hypothetical protein QOE54_6806, partial [Streptosporangiaceae bacterium]|nr:hypothetical protein [Streptosporangiaceae bacterium]
MVKAIDPTIKAALYVRISQDTQGDALG